MSTAPTEPTPDDWFDLLQKSMGELPNALGAAQGSVQPEEDPDENEGVSGAVPDPDEEGEAHRMALHGMHSAHTMRIGALQPHFQKDEQRLVKLLETEKDPLKRDELEQLLNDVRQALGTVRYGNTRWPTSRYQERTNQEVTS